jgi:4-hydroxy-3-polyprenylbenzoate decarboxylase
MKIIVGATGASGIIYFYSFLKKYRQNIEGAILSRWAKHNLKSELDLDYEKLCNQFKDIKFYDNANLDAPFSSGSFYFDAYIIIPATISTLGKIANGIGDNLIARTGLVALKERRKFIMVLRETPLSTIDLENAYKLSMSGTVIMPASPPFYHNPKNISELIDFFVDRVMMQIKGTS